MASKWNGSGNGNRNWKEACVGDYIIVKCKIYFEYSLNFLTIKLNLEIFIKDQGIKNCKGVRQVIYYFWDYLIFKSLKRRGR